MVAYTPKMTSERIEELRRWHEDASAELHGIGALDVEYLGLHLHVPEHVFPPTPTSDLLGSEVIAGVQPGDRVLDMGCGAGANAILAAKLTEHVVAVDVNPHAVSATAANADRNGVGANVRCLESDVFSAVDGDFDVIVIDPPFRWFEPRDLLERAVTDHNYEALGQFFAGAAGHLRPTGFILLFFGTSGDVGHLEELIAGAGLMSQVASERTIHTRGQDTTYFVRRIASQ